MSDRLRAQAHLALPLLIAAGAFAVHRDVLDMPLFGFDAYAVILTSRIQNFSDFLGTFSELMMDGRLWAGDFYRPVGNLFLAVDYAIWGIEPFGYQLSNMLLWCATIVALFALCRRLLGAPVWIGPCLAALFFALHPATLSILPFLARRTETLMVLFVALCLVALPRDGAGRLERRHWIAGLFALAAVGSKETGIIAVPLVFAHQFLLARNSSRTSLVLRFRLSLVAAIPAALLSAALLGARFFVIGGLGGYHIGSNEPYLSKLSQFALHYLSATFVSGGFDVPGRRALLMAGISITLLALCVYQWRASVGSESPVLRRLPVLLAVAGAWLAVSIGLACTSMQFSSRYVMPMTFSAGLLLGGIAEASIALFRAGGGRQRSLGLLSGGALLAITWVGLSGSALTTRYPELRQASRIQTQLLEVFAQRLDATPGDEPIDANLQRKVAVRARAVDDVWMIAPWGLNAWLELIRPDRSYKVRGVNRPGVPSKEFWSVTLEPRQTLAN